MGKNSGIEYTHDTFNGWIGCSKVEGNPQCAKCYAETMAKMRGWAQWGDEHPRMLTREEYWQQPFKWDDEACESGEQRRVFAYSLGDVFDRQLPNWPRDRVIPSRNRKRDRRPSYMPTSARTVFFHSIVKETPGLTWMIFSKRYDDAAAYYRQLWSDDPWPNVWTIFSAGTQQNLEEATAAHRQFESTVHGISAEPSFENMDWTPHLNALDWVIGGTESGSNPRHVEELDWFRSTRDQVRDAGVSFYMKQITDQRGQKIPFESWPGDLRIRQFPEVA